MLKSFTRFNPTALDFDAMRESAQFSRNPQKLRNLHTEAPELLPDLNQSEQELARLEKRQANLNPEPTAPAIPAPTEPEIAQATAPHKAADPAAEQAAQAKVAQQLRMQKSKVRTQLLQDLIHHIKTLLVQAQSEPNTERLHAAIWSCQSSITAPYGGKTAPGEKEGLGVVRPFLVKQSQKLNALKNKQPELLPRIQAAETKVLDKLKQFKGLPLPEKSALCALAKGLNQLLNEVFQAQHTDSGLEAASLEAPELKSESLELPQDPDQIKRELFQLNTQLRQSTASEKAALQSQIQVREAALEHLQWQKTQQLLQRTNRSLSLLCDKVERLQTKQNSIQNYGHCLELQREHKYCHNLVRRELQRLKQAYSQQQQNESVGPQFFLAQLQYFGSFEADHAVGAVKPELLNQLPAQILPAFEQMAEHCQTLFENLRKLVPELRYQEEWHAAQSRLEALEQLESDYAEIDLHIEALENQLKAEEDESEALLKSLYALHLEKWELYTALPGQLPQIGETHARN